MTKHEELCAAYRKASSDFNEYNFLCNQLVRRLKGELIDYLGCTKEEIKLYQKDADLEDSFYKFKMGVVLYIQGPGSYPQREIVFHLCIKKVDEKWLIKMTDEKDCSEINADMSGADKFFDLLYSHIKDSHENALNNFLNEDKGKTMIGFDMIDKRN